MHQKYQALYALTWHYILVKPSPRLLKYQALNPHGHAATVEDQSEWGNCWKLIMTDRENRRPTLASREVTMRPLFTVHAGEFFVGQHNFIKHRSETSHPEINAIE
jgi:hypothetical protein